MPFGLEHETDLGKDTLFFIGRPNAKYEKNSVSPEVL